MNIHQVTSRKQAFSIYTNLPVDSITVETSPLTIYWRLVTTDVVTGEEAVVRPVNANEDEVPQDEMK